ncbi:MAG: sigma-70 family RNA polymerase sigma factor [Clostridia bacterium]|nr:sigma-70 family RNA polymerase sigma factor [Clostridia bacterium]
MSAIKDSFEHIAKANREWLLRHATGKVGADLAEDIVQEALFKAARAYEREQYHEDGKIEAWLMRILQNTIKDHYRKSGSSAPPLSLDLFTDEQDDLYTYLPDPSPTPEERVIEKESVHSILLALQMLPKKQKAIFTCRFIEGRSLEQTADRLQMPVGSVKSGGNAATTKIRNILGVKISPNLLRRNNSMENKNIEHEFCKDRLFLYAKGLLSHEKLAEVEGHLATCPTCRRMANAMKKLVQKLTFGPEDEHSRLLIHFPEEKVIYGGLAVPFPNAEEINVRLKEIDGNLPAMDFMIYDEGEGEIRLLADNCGSEFPYTKVTKDGEKYLDIHHVDRIYPCQWFYFVWEVDETVTTERAKEAYNLYRCKVTQGAVRTEQKDMYYQAIPEKAENIRMKRGNGIIECDGVRFAYADNFISEGDTLRLEYSYLLNE